MTHSLHSNQSRQISGKTTCHINVCNSILRKITSTIRLKQYLIFRMFNETDMKVNLAHEIRWRCPL